jgi:hypothetical protein
MAKEGCVESYMEYCCQMLPEEEYLMLPYQQSLIPRLHSTVVTGSYRGPGSLLCQDVELNLMTLHRKSAWFIYFM